MTNLPKNIEIVNFSKTLLKNFDLNIFKKSNMKQCHFDYTPFIINDYLNLLNDEVKKKIKMKIKL